MICKFCNKPVPDGAAKCPHCHAAVEEKKVKKGSAPKKDAENKQEG